MAKVVQVKLTVDSDWQEIEVANFYDPTRHNTVRFGANDRQEYAAMKMPDDRVYDKLNGKWIVEEEVRSSDKIILQRSDVTQLKCYGSNSANHILADNVFQYVEDIREVVDECYRILCPMGVLEAVVPLYPAVECFDDPDIKRVFTRKTFEYFDQFRNVIVQVESPLVRVKLRK